MNTRLNVAVLVVFFLGVLTGVSSPAVRAQTQLTDLSLLRCASLGTRIDVINRMNVDPKRARETLDLLEELREETVELNAEYRNTYDQLQKAFARRSSDVEDLAEHLGELEGERLAVLLEFELELHQLLGGSKYDHYRKKLQAELADRINQRHLAMIDRSDTRHRPPRIRLDKHTVNFCPALPQE